MQSLNLKTNSAAVNAYYKELGNLSQLMLLHEGAVSPAFAALLRACGSQVGWTLAEQYTLRVNRTDESGRKPRIRLDGALLDDYKLVQGIWEAKDTDDDLEAEIRAKFAKGYPRDNILFQAPERAVLYQDGRPVFTADLTDTRQLVDILKAFFNYRPPAYEQWHRAVEEFKETVPDLAARLLELIEEEERRSRRFQDALANFIEICRGTINPNISKAAVREMLIQHLLTERIFRRVFDNSDFAQRNVIAREIETVIQALTAQHFSRHDFLSSLDRFYGAIEATAATIDDFSQKQDFLNTVYENFFQGFSVKVADTHGIVYTPQPIVDFMVRSVDVLLKQEFGRSLGTPDVHVLDPFVGTGNFILRVMRELPRTRLEHKYTHELHCNEVMLLPYYIAAMNIEHEFYELTGYYQPFEGICLADTFELGTGHAAQPGLFAPQNSERVAHQQAADITVIIGNPPYNAWQLNENDNNKNRSYPLLDDRVRQTYAKASAATLNNALYDPYVKAFRWATDRIGDEGIIAFVSNNSFVDALSFDGMRKHLGQDFDAVYVLDLGGNVRQNPKLSGTTHNVFGIQVGVAVTLLVKHGERTAEPKIFYACTDEYWRKGEKYDFLEQAESIRGIEWQDITPNARHAWLVADADEEFYSGLPIGSKDAKAGKTIEVIFQSHSNGVKTNRDIWAFNFSKEELTGNITRMISVYNDHVARWHQSSMNGNIDEFVDTDSRKISWSGDLKEHLKHGRTASFDDAKIRKAVYRPFTKRYLFFDTILNNRRYLFPIILPDHTVEEDNRIIASTNHSQVPFSTQILNVIPSLDVGGRPTQCFPLYTYDEDGSNRRDNITDWALAHFRGHYGDESITKLDIFHYVYGLLHHPGYRERYADNLRRDLPHIPLAPAFHPFAVSGRRLAELHLGYESQPEYPLDFVENPDLPLDWRVEKMKLSKDKTSLRYNDFLTLSAIPPQVYDYRLGNRSALEWIVDQYRVKIDSRSGIVNDPNRQDDPQYIVRLIGQIVTVSLETVQVVAGLAEEPFRAEG